MVIHRFVIHSMECALSIFLLQSVIIFSFVSTWPLTFILQHYLHLNTYPKLYSLNKMSWSTSLEEIQRESYRTRFINYLIHRDLKNMFLTALVCLMEMTLETDSSWIPVFSLHYINEFGQIIQLFTWFLTTWNNISESIRHLGTSSL